MRTLWLKIRFYEGAGFFHYFLTNFLVLYMVTGEMPPSLMETLYFFFSILLAINEGDIFSFILHCGSHSVTLFAISTLLATAANQPITTSANHPLTCQLTCCAVISGWQQSTG